MTISLIFEHHSLIIFFIITFSCTTIYDLKFQEWIIFSLGLTILIYQLMILLIQKDILDNLFYIFLLIYVVILNLML